MPDRMATEEGKTTEERTCSSDDLLKTIKDIIHEGNVRRIVIKDSADKTLLEIPLAVGIVGLLLLPIWAAVGAIVAVAADFKIIIERDEPVAPTS